MPLTSGSFVIPKAEAKPLLTQSRKDSFVLQNATPITVTGSGAVVPVFTEDVEGGWVAEAAAKPVDEAVVSSKEMLVRKWAVVVPVSQESVTDQNSMDILAEVAANATGSFGRAVDRLAVTGGGFNGQSHLTQTTKTITLGTTAKENGGIYGDLNQGIRLLVRDNRDYTGALLDTVAEPEINDAVDTTGRPIFVDVPLGESNPAYRFGRLLGRPALLQKQIRQGDTIGFMGDWSRVFYGLVGDIQVDYDNRASYVAGGQVVSAFQNNLVLVRVEARVGVLIADPEDFVEIIDKGGKPSS